MWILGVPLLVLVLLTTLLSVYQGGGKDEIDVQTETELVMYRTFVSVADMHFKSQAAPSSTTAYTWEQLKVSAPPGIAMTAMNPSWKAVRASDGSWAACTELREVAIAAVGGLFPAAEGAMTTRPVALQGAQVGVGVGADPVATAAVNLCKGA